MLYEIRHRTIYEYEEDVLLSHHLARLVPRDLAHQRCRRHSIETAPNATTRSTNIDHFGNTITFLTIEGPHRRFELTALASVELAPSSTIAENETPPWENVRDLFAADHPETPVEVAEFTFESPLVSRRAHFADYAKESFAAGRALLTAANELNARIYRDFTFDSHATTVTTPVGEFFKLRRGVCQDFAHLMISCLRSLGLPARYVSGYLETQPAPGQPKLAGADASHAWASLWCGESGWVDLDPANNVVPTNHHVTTAWGRDYSDVSPVRGVIVGSGSHRLTVAVDVTPRS